MLERGADIDLRGGAGGDRAEADCCTEPVACLVHGCEIVPSRRAGPWALATCHARYLCKGAYHGSTFRGACARCTRKLAFVRLVAESVRIPARMQERSNLRPVAATFASTSLGCILAHWPVGRSLKQRTRVSSTAIVCFLAFAAMAWFGWWYLLPEPIPQVRESPFEPPRQAASRSALAEPSAADLRQGVLNPEGPAMGVLGARVAQCKIRVLARETGAA